MADCTDSSNEEYKIYWFNYFVSIGYIDNSDLVNLYAPYGKCTRSLLWITYLINIVHFFLLSSAILYLLNVHRNRSGFWWPFITWILSLIFLIASIIIFILLNLNITLFSILIIAFQLSFLMILWIAIFIVIIFAFPIEYRYQRFLFFFIIILLIIQIGCIIGQALMTLHCLFNLKFVSTFLDYGYWSAILAGSGILVSTLLLDHIFMWYQQGKVSTRVRPAPMVDGSTTRSTSPVDSVILEDFYRESKATLHHIYSNNDRTRRFRIQPIHQRSDDTKSNVLQLREFNGKRTSHSCSTTSEA